MVSEKIVKAWSFTRSIDGQAVEHSSAGLSSNARARPFAFNISSRRNLQGTQLLFVVAIDPSTLSIEWLSEVYG